MDLLLVERFKQGDGGAFDEMVKRYWDRIYSTVYRMLHNSQDAEEVTQDAFIRAHRALGEFRGDSTFSTWLFQIAINLARNRYWYWWRRKRHESVSFDAPLGPDSNLTLVELLPADVADPGEAALSDEFTASIARGIDRLSVSHREILILRNVKNLSYDEIARTLRLSVGTVKSRIARAREALRARLNKSPA